MSKEGVRKIVGRMVSDSKFRTAVLKRPKTASAGSGYSVTTKELAAISRLKNDDFKVKVKTRPGAGGVASYDIDVRTVRL